MPAGRRQRQDICTAIELLCDGYQTILSGFVLGVLERKQAHHHSRMRTLQRPADLVDRDFEADRPNRLWLADLERHEAFSDRAWWEATASCPSQRTR